MLLSSKAVVCHFWHAWDVWPSLKTLLWHWTFAFCLTEMSISLPLATWLCRRHQAVCWSRRRTAVDQILSLTSATTGWRFRGRLPSWRAELSVWKRKPAVVVSVKCSCTHCCLDCVLCSLVAFCCLVPDRAVYFAVTAVVRCICKCVCYSAAAGAIEAVAPGTCPLRKQL